MPKNIETRETYTVEYGVDAETQEQAERRFRLWLDDPDAVAESARPVELTRTRVSLRVENPVNTRRADAVHKDQTTIDDQAPAGSSKEED